MYKEKTHGKEIYYFRKECEMRYVQSEDHGEEIYYSRKECEFRMKYIEPKNQEDIIKTSLSHPLLLFYSLDYNGSRIDVKSVQIRIDNRELEGKE